MKTMAGKSLLGLVASLYIVGCWGVALAGKPPKACVGDVYEDGSGTFASIGDCIQNETDGECLVCDGTYFERINFGGRAITLSSVNGAASTIIDGEELGSVVTFDNLEGPDSVLDGFTIQNGYLSTAGGILASGASPTIVNCIVTGNRASSNSPAGGIKLVNSSASVRNCEVSSNWASGTGGISITGGSPEIIDTRVIGNETTQSGGGIHVMGDGFPKIEGCTISGNTAGMYGGGIVAGNTNAEITNCIISNNTSNYNGGGIYSGTNTTYPGIPTPTITNCTITGNEVLDTVDFGGGGVYGYDRQPTITNSIIYSNIPDQIRHHIYDPIVTYSNIEGCWPGVGNICEDCLVDTAGNIQAGTACIDAGDNNAVPPGITQDFEDDQRFIDDPDTLDTGNGNPPIVDIGADEYVLASACPDYTSKDLCSADPNCEWVGSPKSGFCQDSTGCTVTEDPEVSCADGEDNDCDGFTDLDDFDCQPSSCDGNGTCDSGEDCLGCPSDCNGQTGGKPANRFCCGNGIPETPEGDGAICDGNF